MKKQRGLTQAEKEFDAEVAKFNQEARKILDDRSLSMSARRRLISLKGKALLRPSASGSQSNLLAEFICRVSAVRTLSRTSGITC